MFGIDVENHIRFLLFFVYFTARNYTCVRGIEHVGFADNCIELLKTIVCYEVSFFGVARERDIDENVLLFFCFTRDHACQYPSKNKKINK